MKTEKKIKLAYLLRNTKGSDPTEIILREFDKALDKVPAIIAERLNPLAQDLFDATFSISDLDTFVKAQLKDVSSKAKALDQKYGSKLPQLQKQLEQLVHSNTIKLDKQLRKFVSSEVAADKKPLQDALTKIRKDIEDLYWMRTLNGSNNVQAVLNIKSNGTQVANNVTAINFTTNLTTTTNPDGSVTVAAAGAGSGTVTSASVVPANGFAGSVANPTTTPAITVSTTVTGVLKGNGTAISAAANSDLPAMSATVGGAVPTPPNNTTTFLRGDGTFAVPPSASGGIVRSVNVISTPTTAGATAATDYIYFVSGTTTLTLPTCVGNTNRYTVKNVGTGTVTVAFTSAQTADGSSTISMPVKYQSLDFISDNTAWNVV